MALTWYSVSHRTTGSQAWCHASVPEQGQRRVRSVRTSLYYHAILSLLFLSPNLPRRDICIWGSSVVKEPI